MPINTYPLVWGLPNTCWLALVIASVESLSKYLRFVSIILDFQILADLLVCFERGIRRSMEAIEDSFHL